MRDKFFVFACKQVNRLLKALQRDQNETDSDHSGDGSNTDSGRGPSEEGESARTRLMAAATRGQRLYHTLVSRVGFLPRQKLFLPGQWKKPVKTAEKTGKNCQ